MLLPEYPERPANLAIREAADGAAASDRKIV
jgi:hypothetical protein